MSRAKCPFHYKDDGAPTRTQTWNIALEELCDVQFHHRGKNTTVS